MKQPVTRCQSIALQDIKINLALWYFGYHSLPELKERLKLAAHIYRINTPKKEAIR